MLQVGEDEISLRNWSGGSAHLRGEHWSLPLNIPLRSSSESLIRISSSSAMTSTWSFARSSFSIASGATPESRICNVSSSISSSSFGTLYSSTWSTRSWRPLICGDGASDKKRKNRARKLSPRRSWRQHFGSGYEQSTQRRRKRMMAWVDFFGNRPNILLIACDATDLFNDSWRRQAGAWIMLFVGAVAVNAVAQGALRRFTLWPGIEHPTIGSEGGQSTS